MARKSRRELKSDIPSTNIKGMAKPRSQSCCEHREIGKARQKATLSKCKKKHTHIHTLTNETCLGDFLSQRANFITVKKRPAVLSSELLLLFKPGKVFTTDRRWSSITKMTRFSPQACGGRQSLNLYSGKVFTSASATRYAVYNPECLVMVVAGCSVSRKHSFPQHVIRLCVSREPLSDPGFENLPLGIFSTQGNVRVCW